MKNNYITIQLNIYAGNFTIGYLLPNSIVRFGLYDIQSHLQGLSWLFSINNMVMFGFCEIDFHFQL